MSSLDLSEPINYQVARRLLRKPVAHWLTLGERCADANILAKLPGRVRAGFTPVGTFHWMDNTGAGWKVEIEGFWPAAVAAVLLHVILFTAGPIRRYGKISIQRIDQEELDKVALEHKEEVEKLFHG